MTIEEMKSIKVQKGYSDAQVAAFTGITRKTVQEIFESPESFSGYEVLQVLEQFFEGDKIASGVREEAAVYEASKRQGEYTVEDYYALPDEMRVELIDGVIYNMSSPTSNHQFIAGEIYRQIANFIRENKGKCRPMISPVDVRLNCDDKTMVQPDVLILCDQSKLTNRGITGAPDFILEVLSPSTKRKDCITKLEKYREAGVKEYWMIDPHKKKVIVYRFEQEEYPLVYGLEGNVPVGIFEDKLAIDMDMVAEAMVE